jgi:hypothetical protein
MMASRSELNPRNMHDLASSGSGPAVVGAVDGAAATSTTGASAAVAGNQVFLGTFIHSRTREDLEYLHDTAVIVDGTGTIVAVEAACDAAKAEEIAIHRFGWPASGVTTYVAKQGQFFFPGFIGE